jgi:hypothetical protein
VTVDYGAVRVTADGFRNLVNAYFPHDPETLAVGPLVADELRQDLASRGVLAPASSIEGCQLVIDGELPADAWELRSGGDVIASGRALAGHAVGQQPR